MHNTPQHIGIIVDGNRRWAKKKNLSSIEGHRQGLKKVEEVQKWCKKRGVKILTLYVFSTENWNRPKREVSYLMNLLDSSLNKTNRNVKKLHNEGIKVQIIGYRKDLSKSLQKKIKEVEELTKNNKEGVLNLALNYGGRLEITEAVKRIVKCGILPSNINENLISQNLWTAGIADPDLIIRTSGEQRLSNFLIWQSAYSELYFCKKYWPEFLEKDFDEALREYNFRQRRHGS